MFRNLEYSLVHKFAEGAAPGQKRFLCQRSLELT